MLISESSLHILSGKPDSVLMDHVPSLSSYLVNLISGSIIDEYVGETFQSNCHFFSDRKCFPPMKRLDKLFWLYSKLC